MARILVLGAGFAGLWAAASAARALDEMGAAAGGIEILVVDRNPYYNIRVRNYEADLSEVAIPLGDVLDPIGVHHLVAEVKTIDPANGLVRIATARGEEFLAYDRLIVALGSQLARPEIDGFTASSFDVDTYAAAVRLNAHLAALGRSPCASGRSTVVVVGAGFTGIEVATEMPGKLARVFANGEHRIVLVDPNPVVGATVGEHARPVISEALAALGIETRLGTKVSSSDSQGVTLASGEIIPAQTIVWCAGMRASPLLAMVPGTRDRLGRVNVDDFMRVIGVPNVFAAGDAASSLVDGSHPTVMSCQFARPMGRFAGHNAATDLLSGPMIPLHIAWYVTVLDLGAWGALYTVGWDRQVLAFGRDAKTIKQTINQKRIYPPSTGIRADILAAAAPTVQAPPRYRPAVSTSAQSA